MLGQLPLVEHWPVREVQRMRYEREGEPRVLTWERFWCACGDRACQRAWR